MARRIYAGDLKEILGYTQTEIQGIQVPCDDTLGSALLAVGRLAILTLQPVVLLPRCSAPVQLTAHRMECVR